MLREFLEENGVSREDTYSYFLEEEEATRLLEGRKFIKYYDTCFVGGVLEEGQTIENSGEIDKKFGELLEEENNDPRVVIVEYEIPDNFSINVMAFLLEE